MVPAESDQMRSNHAVCREAANEKGGEQQPEGRYGGGQLQHLYSRERPTVLRGRRGFDICLLAVATETQFLGPLANDEPDNRDQRPQRHAYQPDHRTPVSGLGKPCE